jgi:hypothetical protein
MSEEITKSLTYNYVNLQRRIITLGMIIGMNIITLGDFVLQHGENHTTFSFATPPKMRLA